MTEVVAGRLTCTGWTDWADALEVLGQDECLWVDLGGAHHGPAPARLPVGATHLWSWRQDRWVRARIDGDRVLATVLAEGDDAPGEAVTIRRSDGLPWGRYSRAAKWEHRLTLVVTEGSAPVTFAKVQAARHGPR